MKRKSIASTFISKISENTSTKFNSFTPFSREAASNDNFVKSTGISDFIKQK